MTSGTFPLPNHSIIRSMRGVPTRGKSSLGLVQLSGRSLVAYPPARISPFNSYTAACWKICDENSVIAFTRTRAKLSHAIDCIEKEAWPEGGGRHLHA